MIDVFNILFGLSIPMTQIPGYAFEGIALLVSWKFFRKLKGENFFALLGLFIAYGFARAAFSAEPSVGYSAMLGFVSHWLLPFLLGYLVSGLPAFRRAFWSYFGFFLLIVGLSALAYFGLFYRQIAPGFVLVSPDNLLKGFNSHIGLAGMCLMFSFFSLGQVLFRDDLSPKGKTVFFLMALFFLGALFLTGSRGYYIATVVSYSLMGIVFVQRIKKVPFGWIAGSVGTAALLIAALYLSVPSLQARIGRTNLQDNNVRQRLIIYQVAVNEVKARPLFGFGPGQGIRQTSFFDIIPVNQKEIMTFPHLHSFYLNLAADMGLAGFALFCLIAVAWFARIWRAFSGGSGLGKVVAFGLFWGMAGIFVGDCFDTFLLGPRVGMDLFWLTGLVLGSAKASTPAKQ